MIKETAEINGLEIDSMDFIYHVSPTEALYKDYKISGGVQSTWKECDGAKLEVSLVFEQTDGEYAGQDLKELLKAELECVGAED